MQSSREKRYNKSLMIRHGLFALLLGGAAVLFAADTQRPLLLRDGHIPRGIEMSEVRAKKGEPREVQGPVGNPPITRWVYEDGETIVFEYSRVVDSFIPEG